jgi:hypothetical protein
MLIGFYIFFALFLVAGAFEIYFSYNENEKYRMIFKCPCSFLLAISLIFLEPRQPLVYVGVLIGCVGDYFLLFRRNTNTNKMLLIGTSLFGLMHIAFLTTLMLILNKYTVIPYYFYIIIPIVVVIACVVNVLINKNKPLIIMGLSPIYLGLMLTNLIIAFVLIKYGEVISGSIIGTGYIVFIASDFLVANTTINKHFKRENFYIMLTYLVALAMITIPLIMMASNDGIIF